MGIKTFTNKVIFQINQLGFVPAIILMIINVALQTYDLIQFGTYNPYLTILTICILIFLILWIAAYVYTEKLGMYRNRRLVESVIYNDYAINVITPWEWIQYNYTYVPTNYESIRKDIIFQSRKRGLIKSKKGNRRNVETGVCFT